MGDRVRIDVDAERLEELQRQRDAWDPELTKVNVCTGRELLEVILLSFVLSICHLMYDDHLY